MDWGSGHIHRGGVPENNYASMEFLRASDRISNVFQILIHLHIILALERGLDTTGHNIW